MTPIEKIQHNCSNIYGELEKAEFGTSCGHGRDVCIDCSLSEIRVYARKLKESLDASNKLLAYYVDASYYIHNLLDGDDDCQCKEVKLFLKGQHENTVN